MSDQHDWKRFYPDPEPQPQKSIGFGLFITAVFLVFLLVGSVFVFT